MATPKCAFAVTLWKERSTLFTLGGFNESPLKQVTQYSISKDSWKLHSQLPEAITNSSAVAFKDMIYNIGGDGASHSVLWCVLTSTRPFNWKFMDLTPYNFQGYWARQALVVENKVVYFGSTQSSPSFVIEREEDSEKLKVVREDERFKISRPYQKAASCVVKKEFYAFSADKDVLRYSLESREWSLFYSSE